MNDNHLASKSKEDVLLKTSAKPGDLPHWAEHTSSVLVIYSLALFAVETDKAYDNSRFFFWSNVVVLCLFSLEYLWRLLIAPNKKKYVFSFYGIIDFIAIGPAIVTLGLVDLRVGRAFRLMRLLRLAKFLRCESAIATLVRSFKSIRGELALFTLLTVIILYLTAVGIWYFEKEAQPEHFGSVASSIWWSIVTLTTVGYGDAYPITVGGKIFTALILFVGLGFVAVPSGLVASALVASKKRVTTV